MSYYQALGLAKEPFSTSPDPAFFFRSSSHVQALNRLEIAIRLRRWVPRKDYHILRQWGECAFSLHVLQHQRLLAQNTVDAWATDHTVAKVTVAVKRGVFLVGEVGAKRQCG